MKQLFVRLKNQLEYAVFNDNYLAICGEFPLTQASMSSFLSLCMKIRPDELIVLYDGMFSTVIPADAKEMYDVTLGQEYHCVYPEKDYQKLLELGRKLSLKTVRFVSMLGLYTTFNCKAVLKINSSSTRVTILTVDHGLIQGITSAPAEQADQSAQYVREAMNAGLNSAEQYEIYDLDNFVFPAILHMCANSNMLQTTFEKMMAEACMYANSSFASDFTSVMQTMQCDVKRVQIRESIADTQEDQMYDVAEGDFVDLDNLGNSGTKSNVLIKEKKPKKKMSVGGIFGTVLIVIVSTLVIAAGIVFVLPVVKDLLGIF